MTSLGHAGGVDEIAFMLLPAVIFYFVFQVRRRHPGSQEEAERNQTEEPSGR